VKILNQGKLKVTKYQVGGMFPRPVVKSIDTTGYAGKAANYIKTFSKGVEPGTIGHSRTNDYGHQNEAIFRAANISQTFGGSGPLANAPINWGVQRMDDGSGDYAMYPHGVVKPYSNNTVTNIPLPQDAYNYAKTTHSVMRVGTDQNFANYLAQVGVHANLKTTDPVAWQGVLDRYAKNTNIRQVVPPSTYASAE